MAYIIIWIRRRQSLLLRLFLCWAISLSVLQLDDTNSHDLRLRLRGDQTSNSAIWVLNLKPSDLARVYGRQTHGLMALNEVAEITDSFFWDQNLWTKILQNLLKQNPRAIGVTLFFGENIGQIKLPQELKDLFLHPKVYWSSTTNSLDRVLVPQFTSENGSNIGSNILNRDSDGRVRRVLTEIGDLLHLAEKLTNKPFPERPGSLFLNYRGQASAFRHLSLSDILNEDFPPDLLQDKIILIGAETTVGSQFSTPLGSMNRADVIAHITDSLLQERWIRIPPWWMSALSCALVVLFCGLISLAFPQSVALLCYLGLSLLLVSLSAGIFDLFYFWTPAFSWLAAMASTWFIFNGYTTARIERKNFLLQQEQKTLSELEQLKNNFVSLISHDLKTPIAKIQGSLQRMMRDSRTVEFREDLRALEACGEELNRYIASILKLLRVESREFRLHKESVDINQIVEEVYEQVLPLAQEKQIRIELQLEPLFSMEMDLTLIKEVVLNLLENAIKYSNPQGRVHVTTEELQNEVKVSIQDEGEGIAAEDLQKVWGKFVRGKNQDLKTKGTGLGLYLVKYFVEIHGGQVHLESRLGQGTKVSFTLPMEGGSLGDPGS